MRSRVVAFTLRFSSIFAVNPEFDTQLLQSLSSILPVNGRRLQSVQSTITQNLVVRRTVLANERDVLVIELDEAAMRAIVLQVNSPAFLTSLRRDLGGVTLERAARIIERTTPAPSPPPSEPLGTSQGMGVETRDGELSQTVLWIIIVAVLAGLCVVGSVAAYCYLKRGTGKTVQIFGGRPALRRNPSPPEAQAAAHVDARSIQIGFSPPGMASSSSERPGSPDQEARKRALDRAQVALSRQNTTNDEEDEEAATNLALASKHLEDLQTAIALRVIDDVRSIAENLSNQPSPRSPRSTTDNNDGPPALTRGSGSRGSSPRASASLDHSRADLGI